jgi:pimeloyl-ACP methyl ester carboxylesterase
VFISKQGSGPRLFLGLHGWSGTHDSFAPLIHDLPEDCTFYSVDLPGCGRSEDLNTWSLSALTTSLVDVARSIPGPFTLIGNCSGALLGLLAAQQLKGRIHRMLLIDPFAEYPWYFRIFLWPVLGPLAYYVTFANPLGRWIANLSLMDRRTESTSLTGGFSGVRHRSTYRYLRLFESYPSPDSFRDLEMPIDLIYGENTFAAVLRSIPRWQLVWPQAQAWKISGAGHLPMLEAPALIREILIKEGSVSTECLIPPPITVG